MYRAYRNDNIFFDTESGLEALALTSASLSLAVNSAGTFTFSLAPSNTAYDSFSILSDYVSLYRDDERVFYGRVYSVSKTLETVMSVECEGIFSVLNDSILRPDTYDGTLQSLIEAMLNNHNSQVSEDKWINAGDITVTDAVTYRAYENYTSTMERLQDLIDSYGGYMSVRKEPDGLYFDWLEDITAECGQEINFGENLLDIRQASDASGIVTCVIPLGKETENADGTKARLTIRSVNDNIDYVEDTDAISLFGRIVAVNIWDDVTVPAILKSKAVSWLNENKQQKVVIDVKAVDLSDAGISMERLKPGQKIYVRSQAHGIDRFFIAKDQSLNILDPAQNVMTLGEQVRGLVAAQAAVRRKNAETVETINRNYALNETVKGISDRLDETGQTIIEMQTSIDQTAEQIELKANQSEVDGISGQITEMESRITQNAETIGIYFGEGGKIDSWFTFDENKFKIGKEGSAIHSEQDNESYRFVNESGDILLEINPNGTVSKTVNVNGQVRYLLGSVEQWVTRKGKNIAGVGINLNDVWIGD